MQLRMSVTPSVRHELATYEGRELRQLRRVREGREQRRQIRGTSYRSSRGVQA